MYFLNVWIHILAAAVWTGGLIYTAAVVVPFALSHPIEERQRILRGLARRFRWIAWGSMGVLILTGVGNLVLRLTPIKFSQILNGDLFNPDKVERLIAIWLPWKLMLVVVMIGLMRFTTSPAFERRRVTPGRLRAPRAIAWGRVPQRLRRL